MKDIIIPDVHGRDFWKKVLSVIDSEDYDKFIFLGDYLDPYSYEGITPTEALTRFEELLDIVQSNRDKFIMLLGNHDLGYIDDSINMCRRDFRNEEKIHDLFMDNLELFNLIYTHECTKDTIDTVMYSHAGITPWYLKRLHYLTDDIPSFFNDKLHATDSEFIKIVEELGICGTVRGGDWYTGGLVWADASEHEFQIPTIENTFQIFGHSQQKHEPIIGKYAACLDVRKLFTIDYNNIEIRVL